MTPTLDTSKPRANRSPGSVQQRKPIGTRHLPDPLTAAQALCATIRATRGDIESSRRLPVPVVEGLIDGGLCRLSVPANLDGHEAEPNVALQVIEELATADASVAWIVWINHFIGLASRHSNDAVRAELFGEPRRIFAGSTRPSGTAVVSPGGFRVSGRWSLVSGCELADWIPVMCVIIEGTEPRKVAPGKPETRMAFVPKDSYRIVDTWRVGGLRGTGSHDIEVNDTFVPGDRTFSFAEAARSDRPLSRMPMFATVCTGCAALCLGIARAVTDTVLEIAQSKTPIDPLPAMRDRPALQLMVASSAPKLAAARLLLHELVGKVWIACIQGTPVTDAQRGRMWESGHHAAHVSLDIVRAMYEAAGTSALYEDCPIERAHRDLHAVMQHIVFAPPWLEAAGRVRFGLAPQNPMF